jgi:hypothetical protein
VILSGGAQAERVFGSPGALEALAPGKFERVVQVQALPTLESFSG